MRMVRKMNGKASSVSAGLALGAAVSVGMTMIGSLLIALFIEKGWFQWTHVGYAIMVMVTIAAYAGSWIAYSLIKHQRILVCSLSGWLYWGMLLVITAVLFGGRIEASGVTLLLIIAGSGCAALSSKGERGGHTKTVRQRR